MTTSSATSKRHIKRNIDSLVQTWQTANTSTVWAHCASVGFFGFLSVFPVMAVFVLLYGLLFSPTQMLEQIALLQDYVPSAVYDVLSARLTDLTSNTTSTLTYSLLLSTLLALYAGSKGINYLIILINLAFDITKERGLIHKTIRSASLTLAAVVVVIIVIASLTLIPLGIAYLPIPAFAERIALWSRWPVLAVIIFGSFLSLYRYAPNQDAIAFKHLIPGAALATVLWIVLSVAFSLYVQNFNNYSAEFGALSAAVVIMLWFYYSAFIVAFGAIYNDQRLDNHKSTSYRIYP